ncbi:MAG: hypothetical protein DRP42_00695 [Tenericutes bacterium]|nr:MAG: hypothetical protein DRP42_00695 [Mycoplasmatota bacterium]
MTSVDLVRSLYKQGYLSKEAAVGVLKSRDGLIKTALYNESYEFFKLAKWGLEGFKKILGKGGKTGGGKPATAWSDVGGNLVKIMALAGLTSAGVAGAGAIAAHGRNKKLKKEIASSYTVMKKEYPRITEMDQGKVRNHFGVLAQYAPSLAANPTVAGAFVSSQVSRGIVDPATVKTLVDTQKKIEEIRQGNSPFAGLPGMKAVSGVATAAMSGPSGGPA